MSEAYKFPNEASIALIDFYREHGCPFSPEEKIEALRNYLNHEGNDLGELEYEYLSLLGLTDLEPC